MSFDNDFSEKHGLTVGEELVKQDSLTQFGVCPADFSVPESLLLDRDCIQCGSAIDLKAGIQD